MTWLPFLSILFTAITAIAAAFSVYHTIRARKQELKSKRPYISWDSSPKVEDVGVILRITIPFKNSGSNSATNLIQKVLIVDQTENTTVLLRDRLESANDLPSGTKTAYQNSSILSPTGPLVVIHAIRYEDPLLEEAYSQCQYMIWERDEAGREPPFFRVRHATLKEKESLAVAIQKEIGDFLEETKHKLLSSRR